MNEIDFNAMTLNELKAYVLAHRDDDRTFYTLVDRRQAETEPISFPPQKSVGDMENYPEAIEQFERAAKRQHQDT